MSKTEYLKQNKDKIRKTVAKKSNKPRNQIIKILGW